MLPEFILIGFSTDGGSLHNSGQKQFWPNQLRAVNIPNHKPFLVAVFLGNTKPTNCFWFFQSFLEEIREITEERGIEVGGRRYALRFRIFIGDAPAISYAFNHFFHNSYNPCSKFCIEGYNCSNPHFPRSRVFSGVDYRSRTYEQHQNMADDAYHKGPSPFSEIIGLVSQVSLDVMHLVYLGFIKKCLSLNLLGQYGCVKLSGRKIDILHKRMEILEGYCPSELNRNPMHTSLFPRRIRKCHIVWLLHTFYDFAFCDSPSQLRSSATWNSRFLSLNDNCFLLTNFYFCLIRNIIKVDGQFFLLATNF